ncbi:MAG: DUF2235 domain-containing protein [Vicinamibacterales bacterium]
MARNIVLAFDGTNNEFGRENTNIVRLVQLLDRDPSAQVLYYDPGVGTLPEPGTFSSLKKRLSEALGLAFGRGLTWKVGEAYTFLMNAWEPGDRVFLFGFSRGAYTARVLAGLLHAVGLMPKGNENMVPYAQKLYAAMRHRRTDARTWGDLCEEFRWTFAKQTPEDPDGRRFAVHYLGVWDTVSSVGWVWDPESFPFTANNPGITAARHAIAIDERRWFFRQNRLQPSLPSACVAQQWFPGVHSDVGGGYPDSDGGLWRSAFAWVLEGAEAAGLVVDDARRQAVLSRTPPSSTPCLDPQHESLTGAWWLAEGFPKLRSGDHHVRRIAVGLGRRRTIRDGELIARCALVRLRERADYRPPNLSRAFVEAVCRMPDVPSALPYSALGALAPPVP